MSARLGPAPDAAAQRPHPLAEQRPWGGWRVLDEGAGYKVKLLEVAPGKRLSLQFHRHRSELWTVVAGEAQAQIGAAQLTLRCGAWHEVPVGVVHRLANAGAVPLLVLEVQRGDLLDEDDIVRLADDFRRGSPAARG